MSDPEYTPKDIACFLKGANSDLALNKYKAKDMIPDYCKAVLIGFQLQSQLAAAKKREANTLQHLLDCSHENERVRQQLAAEQEKNRWIPVGERLPEKTEKDLRPQMLVFDGESINIALWRHYTFGWGFETDEGEPTHWRPIDLPKGE